MNWKLYIKKNRFLLIVLVICSLWLIFSLNFSILFVYGESMEPNLHNGQLLLSKKTFLSLNRFDIVVCLDENQFIIKRIIGLPGETIWYKDNQLYVNGELIEEDYSIGNTEDFSVEIDIDNYYCLGDNRENSKDSRAIGQIHKKNIIAEVI